MAALEMVAAPAAMTYGLVDISTANRLKERRSIVESPIFIRRRLQLRGMDVLGGLLDGVRARGAFVLRLSLDPPWSMRIQDDAPLTLICMTAGEAVVVTDSGETFPLRSGDVALARGVEHYVFADTPATTPQVVIHPGNRCTTLRGEDLRFAMSVGVRTWGNAEQGAHRGIVCAYEGRSEVSARLLNALPTVLV